MNVLSVSFLGLCTREFDAMRRLYAEAYGLPEVHSAPGVAWFQLDDGAEVHVYADTDDDHAFFGAAPVPGLLVDDFAAAVERLTAHGVQWLTEPDVGAGRTWRHYRAPDGNVYEVMGPRQACRLPQGTREGSR